MKFLMMVLAMAVVVACSKNDDEEREPVVIPEGYVGKIVVGLSTAPSYTQEDVVVEVKEVTGTTTVNVVMKQVKFADAMPVKMDITISGIATEEVTGGISLSGDEIIPTFGAANTPYPQGKITNLQGTLTSTTLTLTMICGEDPLTFSGAVPASGE